MSYGLFDFVKKIVATSYKFLDVILIFKQREKFVIYQHNAQMDQ
jgi:hypothetical protein